MSPFPGILGHMNRTERLYAIAEELRAAGPTGRTSAWLARRLEVSTRTIKRDVDALLQAGVPLWTQAGPGGGYVLDATRTLPPLNITGVEAAAIAVALAALPALPFAVDARTALSKVLAAMAPAERQRAEEIAGRLRCRPRRSPGGGEGEGAVRLPTETLLRAAALILAEHGRPAMLAEVQDFLTEWDPAA
jgi:hypothetical protein